MSAMIGTASWDDLALNLAADILGALLILMVVERRFRPEDLEAVTDATPTGLRYLLRPNARRLFRYATALQARISFISSEAADRNEVAPSLLGAHPSGCVLIDDTDTHAREMMLSLAHRLAHSLAADPEHAPVPVWVPMRLHVRASLQGNVWFEGFRKFDRALTRFRVDEMLAAREVVAFLDCVDNSPKAAQVSTEIRSLRTKFPRVIVIASSRDPKLLQGSGLPTASIEP